MLQTLGLQFHRATVLLDELGEDKFQRFRPEWHPAKNVPGRDNVNSAVIAGDGRDGGQAREPVFPRPNAFRAHVRQNEIDGRRN